ncbi:MAG: UPF0104 family protein [Planctomycetes bacterium]|nr:UPF0104 family protein [Planctomycetota bacterium]
MKHKSSQNTSPARDSRRRGLALSGVLSVGLFLLAVALLYHALRDYRLQDILHQLRQVGGPALLAAVGLTVVKYFVLTASDALALQHIRHPLAYHKLAFASFVGSAFTNAATFFGGGAARYRIYSSLGLSARQIGEMVLFCGYTFWLGFFLVTGATFVLEPQLAVRSPLADLPRLETPYLPAPSVWITGIGCLALVGIYMAAVCLRRRPLTIRGWQLRVPSAALSAGQIAVTSIDWLLAAAVLYVLLPGQMHVPFVHFLGIFMLGQGAGMISHVPGGLGVFETILLYSLPGGGDAAAMTAALLLYRLIYYILPLLLGSLLLALHGVLPPSRPGGEISANPTFLSDVPD